MSNYTKIGKAVGARTELHDKLNLTGAEISVNTLEAGSCVPFVHAHKENEEIYFIISGKGKVTVDDEEITLSEGDWIKIAPAGKRQFFASSDSQISYICIQVKAGSLGAYTADDAL
ncbi:MAG TPA: cupin domain-containing protein [Candidatus Ornithospirochaeta avicola]|uniref:Cupin domain-containing protein n=1 Tax=Candidatus Ornithospirochaeta avicola TaxID=2840896 RepID=A0A9D1PU00_9SPIO|nr:cupin domain-containing protein [Candidatus Ornithospirochaeta avicola]